MMRISIFIIASLLWITTHAIAATPVLIDVGNGTIVDTANNLTWLKNAKCFSGQNWNTAMASSAVLASGQCGLTDGSTAGDWHLPTINELRIFTDNGLRYDTLNAAGFTSVQANCYWSSSGTGSPYYAWYVDMGTGNPYSDNRDNINYVWPTRSGQWGLIKLIISNAGSGRGVVVVDTGTISWLGLIGSANYLKGTAVTLTATPNNGSSFAGWSGCDSVSGSSCTVAMNIARNVTANFVDIQSPVVTAFTLPATSTMTVGISTFTANDNVNVTGYKVTESATAPLASDSDWNATVPPSYTFAASGVKTLYAWAKDAAGNVSNSVSASIIIETTKPTVTAFTLPATSTSLTVGISTFTATDNVAVTGYLLTETASAPLATDNGWSASAATSYTFATSGMKTLYAWAKDAAGNVSACLSASIDAATKPVITAFTLPVASSSLTVAVPNFII